MSGSSTLHRGETGPATGVLKHEDVVLLLLDFLEDHNYIHALSALEQESGCCNTALSSEPRFLRSLLLRGRFTIDRAIIESDLRIREAVTTSRRTRSTS